MPFTISESNNQNQMRQQLWKLGAKQTNDEQIRNVATFGFHGFENVQNGSRRLILLTKNNSFCQASKTKTKTFVCQKSGKQCTTLVLHYTTAGWKHVCSFGRLDLVVLGRPKKTKTKRLGRAFFSRRLLTIDLQTDVNAYNKSNVCFLSESFSTVGIKIKRKTESAVTVVVKMLHVGREQNISSSADVADDSENKVACIRTESVECIEICPKRIMRTSYQLNREQRYILNVLWKVNWGPFIPINLKTYRSIL